MAVSKISACHASPPTGASARPRPPGRRGTHLASVSARARRAAVQVHGKRAASGRVGLQPGLSAVARSGQDPPPASSAGLPSRRGAVRQVGPGSWMEQRHMGERWPKRARFGRRRRDPSATTDSRRSLRSRAAARLDAAARHGAATRSNSSNRRGIVSPVGSKSIARFGRGRMNRKRVWSGGRTSAISCAAAPWPFEVDIFLPPMLRNS